VSWWRVWLTAAVVGSLSACAVVPPAAVSAHSNTLSGRMTVRIDALPSSTTNPEPTLASAVSAAFELSGNAERGGLDLNTPLGTTLARARWEPGSVTVNTPQGSSTHADLNAMTRALLGEDLPVAALFDWLRGRPWPGAAVTSSNSTTEFAQLGWEVNLTQFPDSWVSARRAQVPAVTVRVKLDKP
jgi:outer membrane lipoprotein LolB